MFQVVQNRFDVSDDSIRIHLIFNAEILLVYIVPVVVGVLSFVSDSVYSCPVAFTRPDCDAFV